MCIRDRVSGFNPGYIFKALDELDKRKELQAKQRAAERSSGCLLYTSDAADERSSVDLGGRRIIKKKNSIDITGCSS